ncbi:MAG: hypothetical protein WEB59_09615 [Thermoanaerobaculia bacterium]
MRAPRASGPSRFSKLHVNDLAICLAAGTFSILWFEAFKIFHRKKAFVDTGGGRAR